LIDALPERKNGGGSSGSGEEECSADIQGTTGCTTPAVAATTAELPAEREPLFDRYKACPVVDAGTLTPDNFLTDYVLASKAVVITGDTATDFAAQWRKTLTSMKQHAPPDAVVDVAFSVDPAGALNSYRALADHPWLLDVLQNVTGRSAQSLLDGPENLQRVLVRAVYGDRFLC
jgi:hypothetical protein